MEYKYVALSEEARKLNSSFGGQSPPYTALRNFANSAVSRICFTILNVTSTMVKIWLNITNRMVTYA